jgi:signal transduction histidine kinase
MGAEAMRILLVEREPATARTLRGLLGEAEGHAWELEAAATLEEALVRLARSRFDVLLLELTPPRAADSGSVAEARRRAPEVPIVALGEWGDEESLLELLRAGAEVPLSRTDLTGPHLLRAVRFAAAHKRLKDDLAAARLAAENERHSTSEFLARLSHEIRTPLTSVIGFAEVMARELFGPLGDRRYAQYANDILASGTYALDLLNDILAFSKAASGKMELRERRVDLVKLVEGCVRLIRPRAAGRAVELSLRVPPDLPRLWADERSIRQILLNLLSNAVKFTPPQGRVTVSAGLSRDGPDARPALVLSVSDTGIGIAPEDIEKAMAPFGQVGDPVGGGHKGTGLGLPLVQRLVEVHGGALRIASEVGKGTTVTVTFPPERTAAERSDDVR